MARTPKAPWCRVDLDRHSQPRVRAAGPMAGPVLVFLTCRLFDVAETPRGQLGEWDMDPRTIAATFGGVDADTITAAVDGLKRVGLLAEVDGAWTLPGWERYLPDRRDARSTPAERKSSGNPGNIPDSPDSPGNTGASRNSGMHRLRDVTRRDLTGHPPVDRGETRVRACAPEASPDGPTFAELETKVLACKPAGARGGQLMLSPVGAAHLKRLVDAHGPRKVWDALDHCGEFRIPLQKAEELLTGGSKSGRNGRKPPGGGINEAHEAAIQAARNGGMQGGLPL